MKVKHAPMYKPKLIVEKTPWSAFHAEIVYKGKRQVVIDGCTQDWFAEFLASLEIKVDNKTGYLLVGYNYSGVYFCDYKDSLDSPAKFYHFETEELWHKLIDNYIEPTVPRNVYVHTS